MDDQEDVPTTQAAAPEPRVFVIRVTSPGKEAGGDRLIGYAVAERVSFVDANPDSDTDALARPILRSLEALFDGDAQKMEAIPLPSERDVFGSGYRFFSSGHKSSGNPNEN